MRLPEAKKRYLKADMVRPGDHVFIKSEGSWQENTRYLNKGGQPRKDFVVDVDLGGSEFLFRLNKVNRDAMQAAFGAETSAWVGKQARISVKAITIEGREVNVIELSPIKTPEDVVWEDQP
jgi:hypothetical protein